MIILCHQQNVTNFCSQGLTRHYCAGCTEAVMQWIQLHGINSNIRSLQVLDVIDDYGWLMMGVCIVAKVDNC